MEEKLSDHGLDHPFLSVLIYLVLTINLTNLFVGPTALGTSFGSIPLTTQIQETPIILRGSIGREWVENARDLNRPYTYWNLQVEEQMRGVSPAETEVVIRSPGGEIGGMGYHVPGAADFTSGESVMVMLQRSGEDGVYDVRGLTSGKFTVSEDKTTLTTGFGSVVVKADGAKMSLDEYRDLIARVQSNTVKDEDRQVVIAPEDHSHPHDDSGSHLVADKNHTPEAAHRTPPSEVTKNSLKSSDSKGNPVTQRQPASDRSIGLAEDTWTKLIAIGIAVLSFLLVAVFFVRKPNK